MTTRLRDALAAIQRDAFAAFSDHASFERVKTNAVDELDTIAKEFAEEATIVGVSDQLQGLHLATRDAVLNLPFPQELSVGRDGGRQEVMDVGMGALDTFLRGGDPIRHAQKVTEKKVGDRLESLSRRYNEWWDKHRTPLHEATATMHDALFDVLLRIATKN